jgi:hypothetical protein
MSSCVYTRNFIGALTQIKKRNGEGPWGGWVGLGVASGLLSSSRRGHELVNLNIIGVI